MNATFVADVEAGAVEEGRVIPARTRLPRHSAGEVDSRVEIG